MCPLKTHADDFTLDLRPVVDLTSEQFYKLCQANPDIKLELDSKVNCCAYGRKEIEIEINYQLRAWNKQTKMGKCFDSSTGFVLPNGAKRPRCSLDTTRALGISYPRTAQTILPLCPDFAIELMSETDTLGKFKKNARIYRQWFASRVANQPKNQNSRDLSA